ncbi:helix-turn-helix protein [Frisingicoccus caecimuris]|uniref:Helix-turn-helix protein n=2 Tax=Frisingicoccus caecimuris TaxID=1796636 RepID=A0A4R2L9P0_9FIRM|nr:helix-turn-helix protein [Frisingicoccus caecimuris]
MMEFEEILFRAKMNDKQAIEQIVEMYRPLLIKNALVNGIFDEDLYQELTLELLKCIRYFKKLE